MNCRLETAIATIHLPISEAAMASYLLDTNVLSELIRPRPSAAVLSFLSGSMDLWLSVVTLHEISYGATTIADTNQKIRIETWLEAVKVQYKGRVIGIDDPVAEVAGRLRAYASSRGRALAPLDSFIAATAMMHSHVLATRNTRDFDCINLKLYDPWGS